MSSSIAATSQGNVPTSSGPYVFCDQRPWCRHGLATRRRLFEPFFTPTSLGGVRDSGRDVYGIVKQRACGYIWRTGSLGHGTTQYKIYLQHKLVAETPESPEIDPRPPPRVADRRRGSSWRIRKGPASCPRASRSSGVHGLSARNGAEAWNPWPSIRARSPSHVTDLVTAGDERPRAGSARLREADRPESALMVCGLHRCAVLQHGCCNRASLSPESLHPGLPCPNTREVLITPRAARPPLRETTAPTLTNPFHLRPPVPQTVVGGARAETPRCCSPDQVLQDLVLSGAARWVEAARAPIRAAYASPAPQRAFHRVGR